MMKQMIVSVFLVLGISPLFAAAQDLSVDEIVNKANLAAYYAGQDGRSDVKMTITDAQGRDRNREFRILRYDLVDGAEQKFYVYFNKPADVAKMVYMVWKQIGRDDDRWLYLPALDLVRSIAAGDKRSSFVGSHFVYEDVSGRNLHDDEHSIAEDLESAWKLKNTPKDPKGLEFAYYYIWIDKTTFLPMKAEYYDARDQLARRIEALEVREIQGIPTVVKSMATDLERGGQTVMEFTDVVYDIGLTEDLFTERYLRKAPAQWVR